MKRDSLLNLDNPAKIWIENNPEALNKFKEGTKVVIHPIRGIITSGTLLAEVITKAKELGSLEDVVIITIDDSLQYKTKKAIEF